MHHSHPQHGHPQHGSVQMEANMEKIKEQIKNLKSENSTMILATKTANDQAEISYAPYIYFNHKYYLIVAQIGTHYDNITQRKAFQGMIIESEQSAVNTFFRKRMIINFMYEKINNEEEIIEQFVSKHGQLVKQTLMMDFNIFELKMVNGRVILGPGQAFRLDENENIVSHVTLKE